MVRAYHLHHGGISRYEKIRHFETEIHGRVPDEETVNRKAEAFASLVVDAVVDSPYIHGAEKAIARLAGECPLFVVSGTPEDELRLIVEQRRLSVFFKGVFGSPMLKHEIIEKIIGENGFDPAATAMIGDAMTDYDAAMTVGVPFVGVVPSGLGSPFPGGTLIIEDLTLLPDMLLGAVGG